MFDTGHASLKEHPLGDREDSITDVCGAVSYSTSADEVARWPPSLVEDRQSDYYASTQQRQVDGHAASVTKQSRLILPNVQHSRRRPSSASRGDSYLTEEVRTTETNEGDISDWAKKRLESTGTPDTALSVHQSQAAGTGSSIKTDKSPSPPQPLVITKRHSKPLLQDTPKPRDDGTLRPKQDPLRPEHPSPSTSYDLFDKDKQTKVDVDTQPSSSNKSWNWWLKAGLGSRGTPSNKSNSPPSKLPDPDAGDARSEMTNGSSHHPSHHHQDLSNALPSTDPRDDRRTEASGLFHPDEERMNDSPESGPPRIPDDLSAQTYPHHSHPSDNKSTESGSLSNVRRPSHVSLEGERPSDDRTNLSKPRGAASRTQDSQSGATEGGRVPSTGPEAWGPGGLVLDDGGFEVDKPDPQPSRPDGRTTDPPWWARQPNGFDSGNRKRLGLGLKPLQLASSAGSDVSDDPPRLSPGNEEAKAGGQKDPDVRYQGGEPQRKGKHSQSGSHQQTQKLDASRNPQRQGANRAHPNHPEETIQTERPKQAERRRPPSDVSQPRNAFVKRSRRRSSCLPPQIPISPASQKRFTRPTDRFTLKANVGGNEGPVNTVQPSSRLRGSKEHDKNDKGMSAKATIPTPKVPLRVNTNNRGAYNPPPIRLASRATTPQDEWPQDADDSDEGVPPVPQRVIPSSKYNDVGVPPSDAFKKEQSQEKRAEPAELPVTNKPTRASEFSTVPWAFDFTNLTW